jgi:hypothetical protein
MSRSEQQPNSAGRPRGRPFRPGQSGNPGGRPRGLVAAIRAETEDGSALVDFMAKVFRGELAEVTLKDRVAAASWLADRGFGKPPQALAVGLALPDTAQAARAQAVQRHAWELLPPDVVRQVRDAFIAAQAEAEGTATGAQESSSPVNVP